MSSKLFISTLAAAMMAAQCANPVTPSGGGKDVNPPKIVFTSPPNLSTGVKPRTVIFKFDENIQVSNPKEQIVISPEPKTKPTIKTGNNFVSLTIEEDALADNTTYSVQLNESIKDLNENNPGNYKPFLFSTGNTIDTLNVAGSCKFIEEPKTQKVKISTLSENPKKTIASKSLDFNLSGLAQDSVWVVAYNDLNGNSITDPTEDAGLQKVKPGDSTQIMIYPLSRKKIGVIKYFNNRFGCYGATELLNTYSSLINYKDTFIGDSAIVFSLLNKADTSTYLVSRKPENKKHLFSYYWKKPSFLQDSLQEIIFVCNDFLKEPDSKTIIYTNGNNSQESGIILQTDKNAVKIIFKNNQTGSIRMPYYFTLADGKEKRDTLKCQIPVYTPIKITNKEAFEIYLRLKNKNTSEVFKTYLSPDASVILWMLSGETEISYFHDRNKNGQLDNPIIKTRTQGEYYKMLPVLKVKENLSVELNIKALDKP